MPDDAVSPPDHFSDRLTCWSIGVGNYGGIGVTRTADLGRVCVNSLLLV